MSPFPFLLVLTGLFPPGPGQEPRHPDAFLEASATGERTFVGEPVRVDVRLGFERALLEERLVPLFPRPLDLSVQVEAGWGTATRCRQAALLQTPAAGPRASLVLDGQRVEVERLGNTVRDGRTFALFGWSSELVFDCPGPQELAGLSVRYAHATRFSEDVFQGRMPLDTQEERLLAAPLTLQLEEPPEQGRPPAFTGALGNFRAQVQVEPRDLRVGESLRLVLSVSGSGSLERLRPPGPGDFPGFAFRGVLERTLDETREFTVELAPLDARVDATPEVGFDYFDPNPPVGYRRAVAPAVAILVRPAPSVAAARAPEGEPVDSEPDPLRWWLVAPLLVLVPLGLRWWRGRARPDRGDSQAVATTLAEGRPGERLLASLGQRTGLPPGALHGPGAEAAMVAAGMERAAARRAVELVERDQAARYGGGREPLTEQDVAEFFRSADAGGPR